MRFLLTVLLTALLGWTLGLWLPYWSLSLTGLVVGFMVGPRGLPAWWAGALAGGLLWGGLAWEIDHANSHLLATRVGILFGTGAKGMLGITAMLGAVLAGLATWLGARVRTALVAKA